MPASSKVMEAGLSAAGPVRDDRDLVSRARAGDRTAFGELVRLYQDRVFNTCLRIIGDRQTAEDLTQEAFIKAHASIERFDGRAAFFTWLYRIAVNLCLSARRVKRPMNSLDNGGVALRLTDGGTSPSALADRREQYGAVLAALAELDEEHRAVVVLRDIESLDYSEIGEILGVPTGTVKSRLHRGRMALRERLKHLMEG